MCLIIYVYKYIGIEGGYTATTSFVPRLVRCLFRFLVFGLLLLLLLLLLLQ